MNKLSDSKNNIKISDEELIDIFSGKLIFEGVKNCFFNEFRSTEYEYKFDEENYRIAFIKKYLLKIVQDFGNEQNFNSFISRLGELFNGDELKDDIIDNLKKLKLIIIPKDTPITAKYTTIKIENVLGISNELLEISKLYNFDILELLQQIEIGGLIRNSNYFDNLDDNTRHRTSGKLEILGYTPSDMIISIIENN